MTASPKLSIGIPVYNGEKHIRRALDSVLSQSFRDFEVIISDNRSTHSTVEICSDYCRHDARFRMVRHDQTMISPLNFRHVFNQARGEYFVWLECDDWWRPAFLESTVQVLDRDRTIALAFSHVELYSWATHRYGPRRYITSSYGGPKTRLMTRILNTSPYLIHGVFRKSALREEDILPSDFMEIYFADAMATAGNIAIIDKCLFVYGENAVNRLTHSFFGGRMRHLPYWRESLRLVRRNFHGPTRWLFFTVITRRMIQGMYS